VIGRRGGRRSFDRVRLHRAFSRRALRRIAGKLLCAAAECGDRTEEDSKASRHVSTLLRRNESTEAESWRLFVLVQRRANRLAERLGVIALRPDRGDNRRELTSHFALDEFRRVFHPEAFERTFRQNSKQRT